MLAAYGGLNGPLAVLAVLLFAIIKGLHLAVFAWLAGLLIKRRWAIPAIAALWVGIERTHGPLGFAWLTLGNAGIGMALPLRLAPYIGVYGLSFLFAAMGCAVALVVLRRKRVELLWLLALPLLLLVPAVPTPAPTAEAAVVQPNVAADFAWTQDEKNRTVRQLALRSVEQGLNPARLKPSLVAWPEVPAPFYYYNDEEFRLRVAEVARLSGAPFVFGSVAYTAERQPLNSAVLLGPDGRLLGRYDKVNLVPFGEFIPPGFGWIQKISSEAGSFARGAEPKIFSDGSGHTLGIFICYESAFPDLVREFARRGGEVLVNLTNDGYFGGGVARQQHLLLARMRAVENRRWLVRPANDGVTASIDPAGRVWDRLPEFERTSGRLRFGYIREQTLYTRYGDWFAWLALVAGLAACLVTQIPDYRPPVR